jgi:hypothetical protein
MKARELAEQLLKYPNLDVEFDVEIENDDPYGLPWIDWQKYKVCGITVIHDDDRDYIYLDHKEI